MTHWTLIRRSLRYHARSHLGAFLGAAVGSAVLVGALLVGDSVRGSLRELARQRLGDIHLALSTGDRFFEASLAGRLTMPNRRNVQPLGPLRSAYDTVEGAMAVLQLPATATRADGATRANQVVVYGLPEGRLAFDQPPDEATPRGPFPLRDPSPLPPDSVLLNAGLATQLGVGTGDTVVLRIHQPGVLSRETAISPRDEATVALRLQVHGVLAPEEGGNLSLTASQAPPWNAFVRREELAQRLQVPGRANLLLTGPIERAGPSSNGAGVGPLNQLLAPWGPGTPPAPLPAAQMLERMSAALADCWDLADLELELRETPDRNQIELVSRRIFLDPTVVEAATIPRTEPLFRSAGGEPELPEDEAALAQAQCVTNHHAILTYLATLLRSGDHQTPYSMVTAAGPPWVPADLQPDEIVVNQWLADDLQVDVGGDVELSYFVVDSGSQLVEQTRRFRVRQVVPLSGLYADRTLMPEFPGIAKAEKTSDWDGGFPLVHRIRPKDEEYWEQRRGTPKAFLSLEAGQRIWTNRFGTVSALRFAIPPGSTAAAVQEIVRRNLLVNLDVERMGFVWQPVQAQAQRAVAQSQDFGGLFLGFSFFLMAAALLLMALLFQFGIEQRTTEIGTLLALGFPPKHVRRLLWREGAALAFAGGLLGLVGGIAYARAMIHGLSTVWRDAIGTITLQYHAEPATLVAGTLAAVVVSGLTLGLALRRHARRPAPELLAGGGEFSATPEPLAADVRRRLIHQTEKPTRSAARAPRGEDPGWKRVVPSSGWLALLAGLGAAGLVAQALARGETASAGTFFGAGALLLIASLAAAAWTLARLDRGTRTAPGAFGELGLRNLTRRRGRSLATLGLLACGSFLIGSIGVFRLDAVRDAEKRASGTGGFAWIGQSALPVVHDLNVAAGRDFFALREEDMDGVQVVPFRVRDGDEASCLNLNRAQRPRLLGVRPELLADRQAFVFAQVARGLASEDPWRLLQSAPGTSRDAGGTDVVAAIGDLSSILWAMGRRVGDTLTYTDERGREFQVRIVAAVANSILQGNLVIDEAAFVRLFPSESGYRMFLIDAPSKTRERAASALTPALRSVGLELTPTVRRLEAFNAVQNTYLGTFQVLGGLGLLLGSVGLGVVVLRNVLERRAELALCLAVGFRRRSLRWLLLSEHGALLLAGLTAGVVSAAVAVLPAVLAPSASVPYGSLGLTLGAVLGCGLIWTFVASVVALRGDLLPALRNE